MPNPLREQFIQQLHDTFRTSQSELAQGLPEVKPFIPRLIQIACPSHDKRIHDQTHRSITEARLWLQARGFDSEEQPANNGGGIAAARNEAFHFFMKGIRAPDCFVFIDGDIKFSMDAIIRLIFNPYEVTIGAYPTKHCSLDAVEQLIKSGDPNWKWKCYHYPVNLADDVRMGQAPLRVYPGGFAPMLSGATGFMRIKRPVIAKLMADNPHLSYRRDDGGVAYRFFHFDIGFDSQRQYNIEKSEDLSFCELCAKSGIQCFVDISQPLTHCGDWEFEGNFGKVFTFGSPK